NSNHQFQTHTLFLALCTTDTCMKRWGLRASSLSADTKADAGQNATRKHLNPNVLYMMLVAVFILILFFVFLSQNYRIQF
ncbi:MAG: hypothetical protein ACLFVR_16460, partial [Thiohalospira sp.]